MPTHHKVYTVHNTLITYEVWERHQTEGWKSCFGTGVAPAIFDVTGGVADVYYQGVFRTFRDVLSQKQQADEGFFDREMARYEEQLDKIQSVIAERQSLSDLAELESFAELFTATWIGLDVSYLPDYLELGVEAERRSAAARDKAFGFYVGADRLIRQTCEKLFPDAGEYSWYLTLEEARSGKIPERTMLEARAKHYIYYKGEIVTGLAFEDFCRQKNIRTASAYEPLQKDIHGLIGSVGNANGKAVVYPQAIGSHTINPGSIVVARNLEAADLPLLEKAGALVLDAGSYYDSAVMAARTMKMPCIFDAKTASLVLKTGDRLNIDGASGKIVLDSKPKS
jgi:phosphohistidine swiveling domain-containing protein